MKANVSGMGRVGMEDVWLFAGGGRAAASKPRRRHGGAQKARERSVAGHILLILANYAAVLAVLFVVAWL